MISAGKRKWNELEVESESPLQNERNVETSSKFVVIHKKRYLLKANVEGK